MIMKKLMLLVLLGGFLFTSCQKDDLTSQTDLEAVAGKGKGKGQDKKEESDAFSTFESTPEEGCVVNLLPSLPATVDFEVTDKGSESSYFDILISDGDLQGSLHAWCVDQEATLNNGAKVKADVFSSYDQTQETKDIISDVITTPDNFPAVNWLINQDYVGKLIEGSEGLGAVTMGDVQKAVWAILGEPTCQVCEFVKPFDQARVDKLVELALGNLNFIPAEGDLIGIILIPQGGEQSIIIFIPVECEPEGFGGCETAFAYDDKNADFD